MKELSLIGCVALVAVCISLMLGARNDAAIAARKSVALDQQIEAANKWKNHSEWQW